MAIFTLTAFPKALYAEPPTGRCLRDAIDCNRDASLRDKYLFSQPIIGTWLIVIATRDGDEVGLFTLAPEGLNRINYDQRSRFSPLQFHSNLMVTTTATTVDVGSTMSLSFVVLSISSCIVFEPEISKGAPDDFSIK